MTILLVILFLAAAVLEVVGLVFTIMDLNKARRRLDDYLSRGTTVPIAPAWSFGSAHDPTVATAGGDLAERVDALEQWRRGLGDVLDRRDEQLRGQVLQVVDSQLQATRGALDDRFGGLREYVIGDRERRWFVVYKGPVILVAGVLLGLLGNLVALVPQ